MAHPNVETYRDKIYCRLPEGMEGFGGYRRDILVDNLSEREINLFVCKVCHGIMRGSCFKEHRDRPDSLVTDEIRREIGNIKVSCPIKVGCPQHETQCKWIGKLSQFEIHINQIVGHGEPVVSPHKNLVAVEDLASCCCVTFLVIFGLFTFFIFQFYCQVEALNQRQNNFLNRHDTFLKFFTEQLNRINRDFATKSDAHQSSLIQRLRLDQFERELICMQDQIKQIGNNFEKSNENSFLISNVMKSFHELHESYQKIRLNPYSPQKGVIWNIYQVSDMFEKPTELSGPEFYVHEYKFQPTIDTLREGETCVTFCIALVNCNHYDKVKWPMELEENGFRVFLYTHKDSSEGLYFEIHEGNKIKFGKPKNEKNKPLCKQWLYKEELMKYVENDGITLYILNANTTQPDLL